MVTSGLSPMLAGRVMTCASSAGFRSHNQLCVGTRESCTNGVWRCAEQGRRPAATRSGGALTSWCNRLGAGLVHGQDFIRG